MDPINFPETNYMYAKDQPEYRPLPVFKNNEGSVVHCWKLSWKERWKILWSGELWINNLTFNQPLQPIFPTVNKSDVIQTNSK